MKRTAAQISPAQSKKLTRENYDLPAVDLAEKLLGKVLARKLSNGDILKGTIVETEAYPGKTDAASVTCHRPKSEKNAGLFMDPGTTYVYITYGMYHCINISAKEEGGAILLRGIQPLEDYESMHNFRLNPGGKKKKTSGRMSIPKKAKKRYEVYELANGPGKLCMAFDIDRHNCNQLDLTTSDELWIEEPELPSFQPGDFQIEKAKRVGIDSTPPQARNQLWRFLIGDNCSVSTAKPGQILKRLKQLASKEDNAEINE